MKSLYLMQNRAWKKKIPIIELTILNIRHTKYLIQIIRPLWGTGWGERVSHILYDGTDRLSRNVDKQLPLYDA